MIGILELALFDLLESSFHCWIPLTAMNRRMLAVSYYVSTNLDNQKSLNQVVV
jgi:hypothetical protein